MADRQIRCVITGLGVISAIGGNVEECWDSILASRSGIAHTNTLDTADCYADYAAEVKGLEESDPTLDRAAALCLRATGEALSDAGLSDFGNSERASVIMGSCVGGGRSLERYYRGGKHREDILKMPISAIANQVAGVCHAGGIVTNVANACAAGTISIAYAADLIRAGKADVVLAGGTDGFSSVPYAGFLSLHALDENSCSPFNHSHGITLGEGAGVLVVESYEHAVARGAHIYCEILGSGISSDAHHISLHTIFDGKNDSLSVSSTKAMTGHCLGAAGAIEAVFAIKALVENTVPPTIGYSDADLTVLAEKAGKLDFCPNVPRRKQLDAVMNNSFAFGGNNASIIFGRQAGEPRRRPDAPDILLTGIGLVTPLGNGKTAYLDACRTGAHMEGAEASSHVTTADYDAQGLKMAFYRKLDHLSQMQAVSGMDALHDAAYTVTDENAGHIGMIIGTSEGAVGPSCDFQNLITQKGNAGGSAFKFPNTVYNAAGGYLSICSGIKGYNVTVTNGNQSGLQSVAYAMQVIRDGRESAMIATGTDESDAILSELYHGLGLAASEPVTPYAGKDTFPLSDGSVSLVLETADSAAARGAVPYCRVRGYGMAHSDVPFGTVGGSSEGLVKAVRAALADAELTAADIDGILGFANGMTEVDSQETAGLSAVFDLSRVPVLSVKQRTGEGRAASAALALAHGAFLLHGDLDAEPDAYLLPAGKTGMVQTSVSAGSLRRLLAVSFAAGGSYTAVVIEKVL